MVLWLMGAKIQMPVWNLFPGPLLKEILLMTAMHCLQPGNGPADFECSCIKSPYIRLLFLVLFHLALSLIMQIRGFHFPQL